MKTYKLKFDYKTYENQRDGVNRKFTIVGILPSQVRESVYSELDKLGITNKDILKFWKKIKVNMIEEDLIYPVIKVKLDI